VIPGVKLLYLSFNANTEAGLVGYDIYASNTNGFTADSTTYVKTIAPTDLTAVEVFGYNDAATPGLFPMETGTTYYIKLYARTNSGDVSALATEVSGTPGQLGDNAIEALAIDKLLAGDLQVAMGFTVGGQIQTASSGQRFVIDGNNLKGYRNDGTTEEEAEGAVWFDIDVPSETLTFTAADGTTLNLGAGSGITMSDGVDDIFVLDSSGGTFSGVLEASAIDIGGTDANSWHVDADGNMWWGDAGSYVQAGIDGDPYISSAGTVNFTVGTFSGTIEAGDIHIPDQTTAASFHVDSDGDVWVGTNVANKATAPFSIDSATGDVVMNEVNLTGSMLVSGGDISTNDGRIWIKNGGSGTPYVVVEDDSLLLSANGMNISSKYTPPIVFGSTDSAFTTENPKALAAIVGVASETYVNDSDGGMYLEFVINGNNPGPANAVNSSSHGYLMQTSGFKPRNDNVADCGGASNRWDDVYATNATIQTSDMRDKENLGESLGLDFLRELKPFTGRWKDGSRSHQFLSAQQVAQALRKLGHDPSDHALYIETDTRRKTKGLRQGELIPVLISAVQELERRLEAANL